MFLLTPEAVAPYISPYYTGIHDWALIGYMPCDGHKERYFSVGMTHNDDIRVVPLFLGQDILPYGPDSTWQWSSDAEQSTGEWNRDHHWILYFMGCDNGSYSKRFETREDAIAWIHSLEEVEFSQLLYTIDQWGKHHANEKHALSWVNS